MRRSPRSSSRISSRSRRARSSAARISANPAGLDAGRATRAGRRRLPSGRLRRDNPQPQRSGAPDCALGWGQLPGMAGRNGRFARAGQSSLPEDNVMKAWIVATAVSAAVALAGPAAAQAPIVIKFSHVVTADTPKGKGALKFQELTEKYTNGKVKVEVYPNSSLYKDKEELEALQLGAVQMLAPSLAKFGPIGVKEFEVFDLPFILPDKAALRRVTDGPLGHKLMSLLAPKGMVGLAYWDNGFKGMSANRPLHMPDDFKGLKMRIQSSKVLEAQMRAIGAIPQVMAFSEVYPALQTGVVDGTENPFSNEYTQKMHEVQKYTVLSEHGYVGYAVIVNKKFWDGLPADIRASLTKAMKEASDFTNEIAGKENDEALEEIKKSGKSQLITLTPEQKAAWRKALEPVYAEMTGRVGKAIMD